MSEPSAYQRLIGYLLEGPKDPRDALDLLHEAIGDALFQSCGVLPMRVHAGSECREQLILRSEEFFTELHDRYGHEDPFLTDVE